MAQDTWINLTLDSHPNTQEGSQHSHSGSRGTAASGDLTVSFDKAKVATKTRLKWALLEALRVVDSGKELTP